MNLSYDLVNAGIILGDFNLLLSFQLIIDIFLDYFWDWVVAML